MVKARVFRRSHAPSYEESLMENGSLEQRFAAFEAKVSGQLTDIIGLLQQLVAEVRDQGHRLNAVEIRMNTFENRMAGFENRMAGFEQRLSALEARLNEQQQSISLLNTFQRKMMQKMGIEYE
jgi:uncharacterized coiled-coil protein SlyX